MQTFLVRKLDDKIHKKIVKLAKKNKRSFNKEVHYLLEEQVNKK